MTPRRALWLIGILAVVLGASGAWHWTPTYDEPNHLEMGRRILQDGNWSRFDNSKMPVSVLNASSWLLWDGQETSLRWWFARLPQLAWLLGTMVVVFLWARERRPEKAWAAVGAAALVAWEPNLLAHSTLVTTDAPCTFFIVAASWTWARALARPDRKNALIAGAVLGLAQAVKFTAIFLVPIHAITALAWCLIGRSLRPLRALPWFLLAAWIALNSAYAFQGFTTRASEVQWQSQTFAALSDVDLPLGVPRPWIEGLDWVKADDDRGHGNVYLEGRLTPGGQDDYFLRALAWKLPLPLILLGLAGIWIAVREGARQRQERMDSLALVVPPLFLLAWFSVPFNFQLGIRYCLPLVPFLALAAARLSPRWLGLGALWMLISQLTWWPWGLSYFNERLVDRTQAWRHLADSNLDWGQTGMVVAAWKADHPDGHADPGAPTAGDLLISANALTGVLGDPARMACFREHLTPQTHLAYAQYPYTVTLSDLAACYPEVSPPVLSDGALPAGEHVLALRFRGEATLTIGDQAWTDQGSSETLVVALVHAQGRWNATWEHEGPEFQVFLDGERLE